MSFTNTGESGYCLYIPSEYALHVYSRLMEIGKDYGARDVGVLTQRFMRIERFIPFWAEELTPFVTPYEAGCGYSVKLDVSRSLMYVRSTRGATAFTNAFVCPDRKSTLLASLLYNVKRSGA